MSRPPGTLCRNAFVMRSLGAALLFATVLTSSPAAFGQSNLGEQAIDAQLSAGEFAPALQAARQQELPAARDAALAKIAAAQARAGERRAAIYAASEMRDDRSRARALQAISDEPYGGGGGGAEPDFESLIELITATIAPNSWDTVGGPGAVDSFEGGVFVDPDGVLRRLVREPAHGDLSVLQADSAAAAAAEEGDVRRASELRKVSLTRLEKQVQLRLAAGDGPDEAMRHLAGLQRVEYLFVYPESGEIVLAGPAGAWTNDAEGRALGAASGAAVLRLDDLVAILRHITSAPGARFGCSITPTQEGLARTREFLAESSRRPLRPNQRERWLEQLRGTLGKQDIDVYGLDPRTRAARVLVEADYRMKLVGMGLEEGTLGVTSYLDLVEVPPGEAPPKMDLLRWWFTLNYQSIDTTPDRSAFALRGQGVQVLSENELLTAQGKRVHTGKSDELNRQFARSFTTAFGRLCKKYPVYADLRNLFDLAIVAALIRSERLADRADWHMTCFGNEEAYTVELGPAARQVESVVNHRVINKKHILAGVSGGVRVDPESVLSTAKLQVVTRGPLTAAQKYAAPASLARDAWWWD